ncbi:NAD kinase [Heyndrickxia sporothermodurans]|uniref:NAD kinase n=1 Tax=Heyndrickxia sporothermodurans TaxID=46224 RepID=A0A150LFG1_9BACI|nr:NAD kinase [Heyndrickxia sporothermodurans]KYD10769.1 NAD kinase [Heyndrickxia sporothermodurans]MBL5766335.1 NAD kinase [Heyndrickxia sporothermodurans]MBL5769774.1 NAD kinase [Heyndrickxia sporothermodurans]MBL5773475.1 NAD kinase [Heyndrickxia sporothermodurans]MBL5777632.1 NAD kinase [Heyndrickxia sporothermodurans]
MSERKNIYLYYNNREELEHKLTHLINTAKKYDFTVVDHVMDANIIISVGSDGTFLQAVRKSGFRQDCLYVGVSTKDRLGMYCDFHIDDVTEMIEAMKLDKIEVRKYPVIQVNINQQGSFYCLNEFSIRSGIIKTFVMDVYIDDISFETFRGDGMLIATPTGSTAYNKSVNGAIVDPLLPCLQVSELASLNNNQYRTLGSSFILSGHRKLSLKVVQTGNDYPTMGMDNEALSIRHVEKIDIQLSDRIIKTVKLKDNSFWEKVKRIFL